MVEEQTDTGGTTYAQKLPPSRELALRKGLAPGPRLHMQKSRVVGGSITTGEKDRNRAIEVLELWEAVELYGANLDESVNFSLAD